MVPWLVEGERVSYRLVVFCHGKISPVLLVRVVDEN
jgi:hypothetical protein